MNPDRVRDAFLTLGMAAALLGASPSPATGQLFDLTGTWAGKLSCKSFADGVAVKSVLEPTLEITQAPGGTEVGARLDFGGPAEAFHGLANPDGKKPETKGQLALIRCSTDEVPGNDVGIDEIGHFTVTTKAPEKGTLKGVSIYSAAGSAPAEAGTCAWKWTRTSAADPSVPIGCP